MNILTVFGTRPEAIKDGAAGQGAEGRALRPFSGLCNRPASRDARTGASAVWHRAGFRPFADDPQSDAERALRARTWRIGRSARRAATGSDVGARRYHHGNGSLPFG